MFLRYIKNDLNLKGLLPVMVLLSVFAFKCGTNIEIAELIKMSLAEYVLFCFTDHYFVMYAWIFFLVYWSVKQIKNKSAFVFIRSKGYRRLYFNHICEKSIRLFVIIIALIMVSSLVGVSFFGISGGFQGGMLYSDISGIEQMTYYMNTFGSTLISTILSVLYMWFGSIIIYCIIFLASEIYLKNSVIWIVVLVVISGMVGFHTGADEGVFAVFFINNWLILHHSLFVAGFIPFVCVLISMIFIPVVLYKIVLIRKTNNKKISYYRKLFAIRKRVYLLYITALCGISVMPILSVNITGGDMLFKLLGGFSGQGFRFIDFLFYISIPVFPLLYINTSWEAEKKNKHDIALFRAGSRKEWLRIRITENKIFILKYMLSFFAISGGVVMIGVMAFGPGFEMMDEFDFVLGNSFEEYYLLLCILSFTVRMIEILLLYEADLLLFRITDNTVLSFLVTFSLYIPGLFLRKGGVLLIGKGSIIQLSEFLQHDKIDILLWITFINLIILVCVALINKKRITYGNIRRNVFVVGDIKSEEVKSRHGDRIA